MSTVSMEKIRQEFLVFLRNSDILSVSQRGVTTKTDTFTSTAGQTVFTLSSYTVRNIRSVTVNSVSKSVYRDYTPTYNSGVASTITFGTGLTLNDSVSIQYDYSSGTVEKVWCDFPEIIYLPNDCPRLGFDITAYRTNPIGIGSTNYLSDALITVKLYDLGTYRTIDVFLSTLRNKLKSAQKSFYYFQFVYPSNIGPVISHTELSSKVFERSMDITCKFSFES